MLAKKIEKFTALMKSFKRNLKQRKRVRSVLMSLCLMLLMSSCGTGPAKQIENPPPLPVPRNLFTPCYIPDYTVINYGDYPGYVAELMSVIERCNYQLFGLKTIEDARQAPLTLPRISKK